MRTSRRWATYGALLAGSLSLGCVRMAAYSETEYQYATSLKVETLNLMDKASDSWGNHASEVQSLTVQLQKAYEYAAGRSDNQISAKQWWLLEDPAGNLIGGFVRTWQKEGTLSAAYIAGKKAEVGQAFDAIAALESGKSKSDNDNSAGDH